MEIRKYIAQIAAINHHHKIWLLFAIINHWNTFVMMRNSLHCVYKLFDHSNDFFFFKFNWLNTLSGQQVWRASFWWYLRPKGGGLSHLANQLTQPKLRCLSLTRAIWLLVAVNGVVNLDWYNITKFAINGKILPDVLMLSYW